MFGIGFLLITTVNFVSSFLILVFGIGECESALARGGISRRGSVVGISQSLAPLSSPKPRLGMSLSPILHHNWCDRCGD